MSFICGWAVNCIRNELALGYHPKAVKLTDLPVLDGSPLESLDI